jgi:hypothetical protein
MTACQPAIILQMYTLQLKHCRHKKTPLISRWAAFFMALLR